MKFAIAALLAVVAVAGEQRGYRSVTDKPNYRTSFGKSVAQKSGYRGQSAPSYGGSRGGYGGYDREVYSQGDISGLRGQRGLYDRQSYGKDEEVYAQRDSRGIRG